MDLGKTGKFIQEMRKAKKLTQAQLAEKLFVSEKTISKWECGKGFPDTSLMLPLCNELDITTNELLAGKILQTEKEYRKQAEENVMALKAEQQRLSKHLLNVEWIIVIFSIIILLGCTLVASYVNLLLVWRILLIVFGFLNFIVALYFSIIIETKVGYFECGHCHHKYIPSYNQTIWSIHMGRTRYMKCPKCGKRSWSKKTINID